MGWIADEIIQQIRDRVDIVDLVGRTVSLRKAGRNYKGLCPFHDEKTPSFNVNPDRQSFYCFGCHEGGNAFMFLMKAENLTFPEAARSLARECGIEIPENRGGERGLSERLFEANDLAQARYRAALAAPGNPAAAYLAERGLDAATIARFEIGFAPDSWEFVAHALREQGIPAEVGERAGLLAARKTGGHYDRLRGRVVFPIRDVRGRVIGFGGRALGSEQEPKYLNTPESPIFRKREAFFGFPLALEAIRRLDRAVVVEGYFDLIALHRAGVEGVVATCGTALTAEHARNLRRRGRHVVLLFDGDEAGQRAVERSMELLLPTGLRVRAAALPAGEDPDTFLAAQGADALRALVEAAPPALDLIIHRAVARGCRTPWQKADAVASLAGLLRLVPSPVERAELCVEVGIAVGTEPRHVEAAVRASARGEDPGQAIASVPRRRDGLERVLEWLARCLLEYPELGGRIGRELFTSLAPASPITDLVAALIEAGEGGRVDVDALCERLADPSRSLLRALVAEDVRLERADAERTVDDTLASLRRRRDTESQRALTQQLRDPAADASSLLLEKDRRRLDAEDFNDRPPAGSPP